MLRYLYLVLMVGVLASGDALAESMTWRFRNQTEEPLVAQLHSRTRNQVWPDAKDTWPVPPNGLFYDAPITCNAGELICYGTWSEKNPKLKWGVGPTGRDGCSDCCYRCSEGSVAWASVFIAGQIRLVGIRVKPDGNGAGESGDAIYILAWQKTADDNQTRVSGKVRFVDIVQDQKRERGIFDFTVTCSGRDPLGAEIKGVGSFVTVNPAATPTDADKLQYDLWWAACRGQYNKF